MFIVLALGLTVAYLAARGLARLQDKLRELLTEPAAGQQKHGSMLVACSACGVHLPQSRALESLGGATRRSSIAASRYYCSENCQRQAQSTPETIRTRSA